MKKYVHLFDGYQIKMKISCASYFTLLMSSVLCDFTKISLVRVMAVWNHLEIYLKDRYTLKTSIHAHLAVQAS